MDKNKERNYMFDTFRGILMLSIPMSHFTKMSGNLYSELYLGGGFPQATFGGFIYITINVFVMQAFMFLSGYFSKKPQRAKETAFKTFMWPYIVCTCMYFGIRYFFFGSAHLDLLTPPFALWFLFTLFFYRFFLEKMAQIPRLLTLSIVVFLLAGQVEEFDSFLALGRMVSYFPFFLLGFYCSKERLEWCCKLKEHKLMLILLAIVLVAISILLAAYGPSVGWYLLKESVDGFSGMTWYEDILLRALVMCLSCGWILLMINILPSSYNIISYVGTNTMPVYIFHLTLRYVIQFYGLYVGFVSCLVVAWFGVLSLIHKKIQNRGLYVAAILISIAGFFVFYSSGIMSGIYGLCPENKFAYYLLVYGGALIAGFSFVCPFWVKLYDFIVEGTGKLPALVKWLRYEK